MVSCLHRVTFIDLSRIESVSDLVDAFSKVGVLGAGRLGRTASIVRRMFNDKDCFTYLSLSGPMVPGGLRNIISYLIQEKKVDTIVSSGANIVHDLVEAYGGSHYRVPIGKSDDDLRQSGMGRIADIFVNESDFESFEKEVYLIFDQLTEKQQETIAPSEFLSYIGTTLDDDRSIVRQAALNEVPIFAPGLMDSMLGFHLYTYSTMKNIQLDFIKDLRILGELVQSVRKTGAIMLGGGLTKHFTMGSTILRGGLDYAVQVTLDRPEGGSLGGAPLQEGVSWQKVQTEANFETVIGDATIIFPILILSALHSNSAK
ncbi:MAG: putative deoxyhypusine synthase [Candidatus Thorarchaeota archaeon]|nr:MAG: putative deoxyhypusine synthase [Candidatus Thorarchaeota archaeon]